MPKIRATATRYRSLGTRILALFSTALIFLGAAWVLVGVTAPWANVTLLGNPLPLAGLFFATGGFCLCVASLILLGARKLPVLCLIGSLCILHWTEIGRTEIPHDLKNHMVRMAVFLSPINRLLDQAHLPDLTVLDYHVANRDILGPGVAWTEDGAIVLLIGSLIGLPSDPVVTAIRTRIIKARCRNCGGRWSQTRHALYCPHCGVCTLPPDRDRCPHCLAQAKSSDRHCIDCGTLLSGRS